MPSRRGFEQSLTWLKSKMAEKNTLDAVNAEVCYNVLLDLKRRRDAIGAMYHMERTANERRYRRGRTPCEVEVEIELPEEWLKGEDNDE